MKMDSDDVIRETKEHNILPCDMTKEELAQENINLLNTLQSIDDLESERKALMADCKSRKERLGQIIEESRHKLQSKQVMRAIPCTLYLNFTKLTATTVRQDTGEQVSQRPMNQDERNMLNATPSLWPEVDVEPEVTKEELDEILDEPVTDSEQEIIDMTGTQLTEQEASDNATELFGMEDDDDEWGMGK